MRDVAWAYRTAVVANHAGLEDDVDFVSVTVLPHSKYSGPFFETMMAPILLQFAPRC